MSRALFNIRSPQFLVPAGMLGLWILVLAGGSGRLDALGNPLGGDFAMFYQAGQTASTGDWDQLYNEAAQQKRLVANFPGLPADTYLPYRYPPLTAIVLAPLGSMPYLVAWTLFLGLGLAVWAISWRCLLNQLNQHHALKQLPAATLLASLMFSPILAQSLMDGQASLFWFAIAVGTYLNIQRQRFAIAGAILALAALKPNVMALLAVVWIVRYPRLLIGLVPSGVAMLALTIMIAGWDCLAAYVHLARELATGAWPVETPYWKVQSLLAWSQLLFGESARQVNLIVGLVLAVMVGVLGMRTACSQRPANAEVHNRRETQVLCAGLMINALFNPYTPIYDLTLLSLGMFAVIFHAARFGHLQSLASRRDIQVAWLCLWIGPIISQSLASALQCPQQVMPLWLLLSALPSVACGRAKVLLSQTPPRITDIVPEGGRRSS